MVELLHDGNLLADLVLGAAELVDEGRAVGTGEVLVVPPELVEAVVLVLAPDALDGLRTADGARTRRVRAGRIQRMGQGRGDAPPGCRPLWSPLRDRPRRAAPCRPCA